MKAKTKQTKREQTNSLTQVSTTYARICVILLALNFCVTGYVMTGVLKLQQEAVGTQTTPPSIAKTGTLRAPPAVPTPTVEVETLENN